MKPMAVLAALVATMATAVAAAQAPEPITWKFAFAGPPTSTNLTGGLQPWVDDVMRDSEGTLKIVVYPGSVLAHIPQVYDRMVNGVFEIGYSTQASYGGVFPGSAVVDLPFMVNDIRKSAVAFWHLFERGPLKAEYAKMHPVALYNYPSSGYQTKKPVRVMEDLRGMKIGTQGTLNSKIMQALGGTPITLTTTENYEALNRNLVDGVQMGFTGFVQFKLQEVTSHHLDVAFGTPAGFTALNKEAYAKLPAKAKAAIDKHSGEPFSARMGRALYNTAELQYNQVRAMPGHSFAKLEPAEFARWKERAKPYVDEWIANTPNGAAIVAAWREELAKAGDGG
jgi:TRAP-type C4-dicarboxylate transport system substrate-binding protein